MRVHDVPIRGLRGPRAVQSPLARWSAAAAILQQGKSIGAVQPDVEVRPPSDTGEAFGLSPASLTVTVGLGPLVHR
jgi:deferrochelatase/peroxidase EfeB